ncbi:MAG TPA: hypothetical protein VFC63_09480 [Blastocatellia bacterium]|nr:hypothetical protein [Blastocatellia bacterium]
MKVVPIIAKSPEQIEERLRLFRALGCDVYKDTNGQLFAVAQAMTDWLRNQVVMVFDTEQVPPHWTLISDLTQTGDVV